MRNFLSIPILVTGLSFLYGCNDDSYNIRQAGEAEKLGEEKEPIIPDMVHIEGGVFVMGDFGATGKDGVWRPYFPAAMEQNAAHEVTLSSYSLGRFKITWENFDNYLLANHLEPIERGLSKTWARKPFEQEPTSRFYGSKPAQVTWQEANNYCGWLGEKIGVPVTLPTSAQWEFAARNRGSQDWVYPTHDGQPLHNHPELAKEVDETSSFVPVGSQLPANPLGLFDMAGNGMEWVQDWFSKEYYQERPTRVDPKGPEEGKQRVVRNLGTDSLDFSFSRTGISESLPSMMNPEWESVAEYTFRCAVQSPEPIKSRQ